LMNLIVTRKLYDVPCARKIKPITRVSSGPRKMGEEVYVTRDAYPISHVTRASLPSHVYLDFSWGRFPASA